MRDSDWVTVFAMIPKEFAVETGPHLAIKPPDMGHPSSGVKTKGAAVHRAFWRSFVLNPFYQGNANWRPRCVAWILLDLFYLQAKVTLETIDGALMLSFCPSGRPAPAPSQRRLALSKWQRLLPRHIPAIFPNK